ncbi:hypothetical protein XU18_5094 [Perkinsela sp. CCAP 1560/4]|nr:hypothetical protein XU18_5094 [Perkinsela sp. CCAP 1560/4]|eukprot:KNH01726.1 hypothetical protein XU18_5094 [Perkinsela sp. CCAP 1560/4]
MLSRNPLLKGYLKLPGRKSLESIVKTNELSKLSSAEIMNIWMMRHENLIQYYGRIVSADAYRALLPRFEKCPYFVIPIFRDTALFNVVTCFDRDLIGVSPLKAWQDKQDATDVHMTIQFFDDFAATKGIVLVRAEIKDEIFKKSDCAFACTMLLKYYSLPLKYQEWVETFNKSPQSFDYHRYLRQMKDEAQRNDIGILDKKTERRA